MSRTAEAHGLRYAPGLDGVRALAVFGVVSYHIGTTSNAVVLPGGFLGVDVFFVLSGYLITSLLLVEAHTRGRISIKQFYIRRARRLLPALYTLLLVVGAIGAIWLPQQAVRLRGDMLAALGYVTNWWLIAQNSSYFATTGDQPPLLTHLWSLAVEEQYYVIWPLVLILFVAIQARRRVMLAIVVAGVTASSIAAVMLYDPWSDPSRVYYGTDTRALAPLLGAALAIAVQPWRHRRRLPRRVRRSLDAMGITALLALTVIAAVLHDSDPALYLGGFLVIALLGAVVVGVAGHPGTALGEMLGTQPLRWLGERSYAIYLWHWPVCVLTRPGVDIPVTGLANAALRIALAVLLAELSYRLIETHIRRHGFLAPLRHGVESAGGRPADAGSGHPQAAGRPLLPIVRTVTLALVMVAGGSIVGLQLSAASAVPAAGGPVDTGPAATLGPLDATLPVSGSPSVSASPKPPLPKGAKVAFFGDSQAMTLLLNRPADLGQYIDARNDTIEGCGVLVGKIASRSGEKRNLTSACSTWKSQWASKVQHDKPSVAVIMIGAWDVFGLTLPSGTVAFGSPDWDANLTNAVKQGIDTLRDSGADVAISLLPCYRPVEKYKGAGAGWGPERGDDDRTRHVNDLLRAAAATYSAGVYTLDPPADFCTNPAIGKNTAYRWDGVHYLKKGSALYFSKVLPQLLHLGV